MKFKGKVGIFWISIFVFINSLAIYSFYKDSSSSVIENVITAIVFLVVDVIFLIFTLRNYILLKNDEMVIILGFCKCVLKYNDIYSLKRTHNPVSSMGLSLDRIGIKTRSTYVLVSVKEKERFIEEIIKKNNSIRIVK